MGKVRTNKQKEKEIVTVNSEEIRKACGLRSDGKDAARRGGDKNTSDISLDGDGSHRGGVRCLTFSFIGVCVCVCVFIQPGGPDT